ncbi:hypothetical protein N1851_033171 [Merluccius polli]|uniref:Uncharacterized protein n=1 Tax=Merluccius polli TaxID=89951 RepID=A0AA47NPS1_MERPO|nr:hypothetical protein N1851_033171 [Merluccius polli]
MTLQCCQCSDSDVEMISCKELSTKTPFCRKTLFLLYGAVLLALVVKNYAPTSSETLARRCTRLLEPISAKDIMDTIFSGKWILQEAYSSDSIDQYALTHSKSSWAEFTKEHNGTITLHMAHMLSVP